MTKLKSIHDCKMDANFYNRKISVGGMIVEAIVFGTLFFSIIYLCSLA